MAKRTEKAGTSGRFGARYGVVVRNRVKAIEANQKKAHECPVCHHVSVKRTSSGIWECKHCGAKFAAGAYTPELKKELETKKAAAEAAAKDAAEVA